jgi:hypothetical protein
MAVQPINLTRTGIPFAQAKDWGMRQAPQPAADSEAAGASDQATVSDQARQLSAALAGHGEAPKLRLSPPELRELISPPEQR